MDLALSADQVEIAETFSDLFAKESTTERTRLAEEAGFDLALWKTVAGVGLLGIAVPEDRGGSGQGFLEFGLVAEAAGRQLACIPLVESAVALHELAGAAEVAHLLERALTGSPIVVVAPRPAEDGVARMVPGGAVADAVLALDDDELVLVESAPGVAINELGFVAAADRPVRGDEAVRHVLASGSQASARWSSVLGRWRLGAASAAAGLAHQALESAAGYAKHRRQFGVPIGSFQAISHSLAEVAMAADGALLLAREAAWRHDMGLDSWRLQAATAYAFATETAVTAAAACLHVHGGYGFTLEYNAQLYLRRAKAMMLLGGDPEQVWEEVGIATVGGGF
ncbi:alkylation response protein AidB-like acyl-CoA dehydrogenase [Jatrophihabitans sp. GAS493]|uniref:acyl-CoA dehydrogenase family protein n=1 Tax=Jatrophihabitans sp. GAS493 TaxID=1907575 RepID=UPI000BC09347|nr:acyl-CoA dehydrogenase family protein [Jatrophihabitans sp. GAS493]SOD72119.1 alkylation response protein AidB-like acyl-CoA dehydrogenase [Jatrophihabitans sp. GAS493]